MTPDDRRIFLTTTDLATRWRMSARTLEGWRDKGKGPSYRKLGGSGGAVRYHVDDIERFERAWSSHFGDAS